MTLAQAWPFAAQPPRRVVLKIGSNVLSAPGGGLDHERIRRVARDVAELRARGIEVVVVSSGAVAAGLPLAGLAKRPKELPLLQGVAAIGQCRLMTVWSEAFGAVGLTVAQVLLTRTDLEDRKRYLNAWHTVEALLGLGTIPVINENDTTATEELTFGDNDLLSAYIAAKAAASLLLILSDIEGLFTANPALDPMARLVEVVPRVTAEIERLGSGSISGVGRGGMTSKLLAARHAARFGVATVIAGGKRDGIIPEVFSGSFRGTLFLAERRGRGSARTHWLTMQRPKGFLLVDAGARRAVCEGHKSLLPVGVREVGGTFARGDVVAMREGGAGDVFAVGISNFSSADLERIKGMKGSEAAEVLGTAATYEEVVHRDNLAVLD
jgi:glutamate 5-kinase